MEQKIYSVTQVNEYIRTKLDADPILATVAVRGEISNYKLYPSGHHYFAIKDESSSIKCVMFKGNAFSLRFRPENGMKVIVTGRISVFPRDGAYQLYCANMTVDGIGDLYVAFRQLKARLESEGLFDSAHKKPIPKYPATIGVVTSGVGAAIQDILRILRRRYPLSLVRVFPVRVQGEEAPGEIADAIAYANRYDLAQLLIVGRGGGSMEDLWCFNHEAVAYAIFDSHIPVISAVGHEPDVTIADYVADLRAATPSNGAELAVPDQMALRQYLDQATDRMESALTNRLSAWQKQLAYLSSRRVLESPEAYLLGKEQTLAILRQKLISHQQGILGDYGGRFSNLTGRLDALSPLKVFSRGYSLTADQQGNIICSVSQVCPGQTLYTTVADGQILSSVTEGKEIHYGTEGNDL